MAECPSGAMVLVSRCRVGRVLGIVISSRKGSRSLGYVSSLFGALVSRVKIAGSMCFLG